MKKILVLMFCMLLSINLISALTVENIEIDNFTPGSEGMVRVVVENNLDEDVKDVSFKLNLANVPFIPIGSSERSVNEINDDDDEKFNFRLKAANDIKPGDYELPYLLEYDGGSISGSIGVKVKGDSKLFFTVNTENSIEGQKGKIYFNMINKGFSDAKFLSVKVVSNDFVLLSEENVYVGSVYSDDFETTEFEVLFDRNPANFKAIIDYKDFDNQDKQETVNLPLTVYSTEEAVKLGIISKSKGPMVIGFLVVFIVSLFIWKKVKRRKSKNDE